MVATSSIDEVCTLILTVIAILDTSMAIDFRPEINSTYVGKDGGSFSDADRCNVKQNVYVLFRDDREIDPPALSCPT